ncbi:MAG: DNA mismatch repair protein MutL [Candidatus Thermofonsia Clade 1 bacterium]|jgi:DNA mismatch repair protein MutL|uniref:DNA mismatch repair protein MutL n=1 Tax=Candidatus Thermofonsia Clade 1 bacterium TaxID=2364210 RepID=A0A2M8PEB3_9CHLR|nr:MAG: DNA mismatch repair protein MutL [Candidatus Thermofonsia Clade 1 bacterium]RMF51489.1 MAG: DNA mismatch repair endonuclease MutL [Chloroflexota bacterium]
MPIQILPEHVAAQIAAGEVVERPASVVKELIENALDAQARSIRVEVQGGGRKLIRVSDDGCGIPAEEAPLAFARHATSKLQRVEDLDNIQTLGFRGEALASIASVARVTMLTRHVDAQVGTFLRLEGGHLLEQRAQGTPHGTVVTVEDLFFNTPARLKFLKAEATERRQIESVIMRYAMAYPEVRFSLSQDGRPSFATSGNGSLADVLVETLGLEIVRQLLPVGPMANEKAPIAVYGYTSAPTLHRTTRAYITLFVNGRYIQDASLTYAVAQAYHTLMPEDRYPIAVLMIVMPPSEVDVNVHPTKAEVRFHAPEVVFSAVQRAVRRAVLGASSSIPTLTPAASEPEQPWRALGAVKSAQPALKLTTEDSGRYTQQMPPEAPSIAAPEADWAARPRSLPPMRIVGQLAATYIVAEAPAGMYLIDQHAAHERILYEQYMRDQARRKPIAQRTLQPFSLTLPPETLRLIEAHSEALRALGFEIEPFGANTVRVHAVPAALSKQNPAEAVAEVLKDLEVGKAAGESAFEAQLILRICKAAAVKAGQILSHSEMSELLRQLERCEHPLSCPHGRPTLIHISAAQLAKEFGRA